MVSDGTEVRIKKDNYELIGYQSEDNNGSKHILRDDIHDKDLTRVYRAVMFSDINTGLIKPQIGDKLTHLIYRCLETRQEKPFLLKDLEIRAGLIGSKKQNQEIS